MAWSNSKIFTAALLDALGNTTAIDLDADVPKVALFDTSVTPDQTVSAANSAYGAGVWAAGGLGNGGWPAAGNVLAAITWTRSSNVLTYDAADTANGSAATIAGAFGCLVYDDTLTTPVADQGLSFHYFGGTQSVTAGTLTVVWNASGIQQYTL